MIARCLAFFLLLTFCFWLPAAYKRALHPFRPQKFQIELPFNSAWETPLSAVQEQEIQTLLRQPFSYFAKGQQSYVFLSADKKYVLKIFRFDTCKTPFGQKLLHRFRKWKDPTVRTELPAPLKAKKTFDSCQLAYTLAPNLTGLIYIHLNPRSRQLPPLRLKDRLGRTHTLDPARYRFLLQKKCDLFLKTLRASEEAEKLAASFLSLIDRLAQLGLANHDPVLGRNFAFLNGEAIAIDVGNFFYDPEKAKEAKENFTSRFARCF